MRNNGIEGINPDPLSALEAETWVVSAAMYEGGWTMTGRVELQAPPDEETFVPGNYEIMPRLRRFGRSTDEEGSEHVSTRFARSRHRRFLSDAIISGPTKPNLGVGELFAT